ncbi:MAG TPA: single-stranded DNA-binding protein [Prolixibacteraceae bacterium]|nr:single-stranded DNA-binding protein [Prolixibacteraceae bacterium]
MSVNKVILIGNVGRDPEIRHLDAGVAVANFPLATSETYTAKNGERVTTTEWHNVVLWRGLAEVAEKYVKKGRQLYIEGRIRTRSYDDKDGVKKYVTEIYGDTMQLLGPRETPSSAANGGYAANAGNAGSFNASEPDLPEVEGEEDLPF